RSQRRLRSNCATRWTVSDRAAVASLVNEGSWRSSATLSQISDGGRVFEQSRANDRFFDGDDTAAKRWRQCPACASGSIVASRIRRTVALRLRCDCKRRFLRAADGCFAEFAARVRIGALPPLCHRGGSRPAGVCRRVCPNWTMTACQRQVLPSTFVAGAQLLAAQAPGRRLNRPHLHHNNSQLAQLPRQQPPPPPAAASCGAGGSALTYRERQDAHDPQLHRIGLADAFLDDEAPPSQPQQPPPLSASECKPDCWPLWPAIRCTPPCCCSAVDPDRDGIQQTAAAAAAAARGVRPRLRSGQVALAAARPAGASEKRRRDVRFLAFEQARAAAAAACAASLQLSLIAGLISPTNFPRHRRRLPAAWRRPLRYQPDTLTPPPPQAAATAAGQSGFELATFAVCEMPATEAAGASAAAFVESQIGAAAPGRLSGDAGGQPLAAVDSLLPGEGGFRRRRAARLRLTALAEIADPPALSAPRISSALCRTTIAATARLRLAASWPATGWRSSGCETATVGQLLARYDDAGGGGRQFQVEPRCRSTLT
uniref:Nuclear receptor domain-containing protein n=1 Tax=Macrostomum lignano TaxID=282301 RepID=A0A1I8FQ82_9PLAT